jgi:tRNA1Val (adenine37-N6)-methyltransferase
MSDGMTEQQRARRDRVRARWTPPPGPAPAGPGDDPSLRPGEGETLDHLGGDWRIFQRSGGHRYSTDDLLTAWYACRLATDAGLTVDRYLDLGSGIGSVAMIVAWRLPEARVTAIEAQQVSAGLFERSARYNDLARRLDLRRGDLRDPGLLPDPGLYPLVTGSPPYLPDGVGGVSPDSQRDHARFERRGGVDGYAATAARALTDEGLFVLVHAWADAHRVQEAADAAGLARWRTLPVLFREDREPLIALYALRRPAVCPGHSQDEPLVVRRLDGQRGDAFRAARRWMGFPP